MATQTQSAKDDRSTRIHQFIQRQISSTTRQVKITDLVTASVQIVLFTLAFFLAVAIVDAWVWALSPNGRLISLLAWIGGVVYLLVTRLVPLGIHRVNPLFAAKVIEQVKPEFKNSLVNCLELQKNGDGIPRPILDAVSYQAASHLDSVKDQQLVDRSPLIRVGFSLVVLVALFIAYGLLSPKNPLQTIGRILAPYADLAKPSSVSISEVDPGDAEVFFGDRLTVTSRIRGLKNVSDAMLVYTTDDGQQLDVSVPMQPSELDPLLYTAPLTTGPAGIETSLRYRVVAGDGASREYRVTVRPAPVISVQKIDIAPPAYTRLPQRTIEGQGEIQGLEGSQVTIHAVANAPIDVAYIELLRTSQSKNGTTDYQVVRTVEMQSDDRAAVGGFVLALNSSRTDSRYSHYQVRFKSDTGVRDQQPNIYPIRTVADLAPEIEFIQPTQTELTVPANHPLFVQVQAADLDFELSEIALVMDHVTTEVLDQKIVMADAASLTSDPTQPGRPVVAGQTITPETFSWKPGDEVLLFATAADNRISPSNGQPEPNVSKTSTIKLTIAEPTDAPATGSEPDAQNPDPSATAPGEEPSDPDRGQDDPGHSADSQNQPSDDSPAEASQPSDSDSNDAADNDSDSDRRTENAPRDAPDASTEPGDRSNDGTSSENAPLEGKEGDNGESNESNGNESASEDAGDPGDDAAQGHSDQANDGGNESDAADSSQDPAAQSNASGAATDDNTESQRSDANGASSSQNAEASSSSQSGNTNNGGQSAAEPTGQSNASSSGPGDTGSSASGNGSHSPSAQDSSLSEGDIQPLPEDASDGEKFEQLEKLLSQNDSGASEGSNDNADFSSSSDGSNDNQGSKDSRDGGDANAQVADPMSGSGQDQAGDSNGPSNSESNQGNANQRDQSAGADSRSSASENSSSSDGSADSQTGNTGQGSSGNSDASDSPSSNGNSGDKSSAGNPNGEPSSDSQSMDRQPGSSQASDSTSSSTGDNGAESDQALDSRSNNASPESSSGGSEGNSGGAESSSDQSGSNDAASSGNEDPSGSRGGGDANDGGSQSGSESGAESGSKSGSESETDSPPSDSNQRQSGSESSGGGRGEQAGQPGSSQSSSGTGQSSSSSGSDSSSGSMAPSAEQGKSPAASGGQQSSGQPPSQSTAGSRPPSGQPGDASGPGNSSSRGPHSRSGMGGTNSDTQLGADDPDLEHARKATDLILKRLKEQETNPDPELLEKMNWTPEELKRFLQRWETMKRRAMQGDQRAQREYENALRSLGLAPPSRRRNLESDRDKMHGLSEDGAVNRPPPEVMEKFNAFLKSRNRVRDQR